MNKFKFYFILLTATITIISCSKDDDNSVDPPRDYKEQYDIDIKAIEDYLKTSYYTLSIDKDVTISKITDASKQVPIWSYLNNPGLPRLSSRNVSLHGITYMLYTFVIEDGKKSLNGEGGETPSNVDAVFSAYKGTLLDGTVFDSSNRGETQFNLDGVAHDGGIGVIKGWSEAFPQFTTGRVSSNPDGIVKYNDFGVGVMFLPSGLGYYNSVQTSIPAYSPLVFSIKLYALKRFDHDLDGIPSYQEDNGDRYVYSLATGVDNPDDTDKDGIPDFLDFDDDGDGYATRGEIKDAKGDYYPFESIPDCSGDKTSSTRIKRHLDPNCIKMNQ